MTRYTAEQRRPWRQRWYQNNREESLALSRDWRLASRYGTTRDEVEQRKVEQGNACAICGKSFEETRPCIDHDHGLTKPRGILCQRCNVLVGWLESDLRPIGEAYIEAWKNEHGEGTAGTLEVGERNG